MQSSDPEKEPKASLSLWDAISIVVGIVVGVSIFKVPMIVFSNVATPLDGLLVWLAAGLLCLVGALCYAELATLHGRSGGDYVYLSHAFGRWPGFLFGWAQLTGVFSGSIGSMAYVFADYVPQLTGGTAEVATVAQDSATKSVNNPTVQSLSDSGVVWAVVAVALLTAFHTMGVKTGKRVQNILTITKIVGLGAILILGFSSDLTFNVNQELPLDGPGFGLAMILVMYAYGGWNDAAFVVSEVKEPQRNVPRALIGGLGAIVVLYLLINTAYLKGIGFEALRSSATPAADVVANSSLLGPDTKSFAIRAISLLVMISALGAVHGLIFTGSRLYAAMGAENRVFAKLGRWNDRVGTPIWALISQASLAIVLILAVGTQLGRDTVDWCVSLIGRDPLPWTKYRGGFETLVAATAPVFWGFFLLSGLSIFVYRTHWPERPRSFVVPLYPLLPTVFVITCMWMLCESISYAGDLALLALIPLGFGLPIFMLEQYLQKRKK
jgi:basic amino acid/polyamine antiporter, APA family